MTKMSVGSSLSTFLRSSLAATAASQSAEGRGSASSTCSGTSSLRSTESFTGIYGPDIYFVPSEDADDDETGHFYAWLPPGAYHWLQSADGSGEMVAWAGNFKIGQFEELPPWDGCVRPSLADTFVDCDTALQTRV